MNYFTRQRLVFWAFVLLVVMNISAIATVIYQRNRNTHSPFTGETMRRTAGVNRMLIRQLDLSDAQARTFERLQRQHFERVRQTQDAIRGLKGALFQELSSVSPDAGVADSISVLIGSRHTELERLTFHHFLELKKNCSPAQQAKLVRIFHRLQGSMAPRHRREQRRFRNPDRREDR